LRQLGQVLVVADFARAGRIPEVHQPHRPRAGRRGRQAEWLAAEQGRGAGGGTPVAPLVPPEGPDHQQDPDRGEQVGEQGLAREGHAATTLAAGLAGCGAAQYTGSAISPAFGTACPTSSPTAWPPAFPPWPPPARNHRRAATTAASTGWTARIPGSAPGWAASAPVSTGSPPRSGCRSARSAPC